MEKSTANTLKTYRNIKTTEYIAIQLTNTVADYTTNI